MTTTHHHAEQCSVYGDGAPDWTDKIVNTKGLHFLPLGGSGEIGMNANFYACDDQWIMVDNGITFSGQPSNIMMADIELFMDQIKDKSIQGLFVTHAHEDHVGAFTYLWPYFAEKNKECKIYATPFTAFILRHKAMDFQGFVDPDLPKIEEAIVEVPIDSTVELGNFKVDFVSLTHSVPEPSALFIRTKHGNIFHTGDWKIDPAPVVGQPIDIDKVKSIGQQGIRALVCDSTNVFEEGTAGSEQAVRDSLLKSVQSCDGRVVISCFSSNIARIHSCHYVAKKTGRKVCLVGRSMERMVGAARHCGYFTDDMVFIDDPEHPDLLQPNAMIVTTGSQAEPRAGLTRMASGSHPFITLNEQDTVIFSSRVIPGNQEAIADLKNCLVRRNIKMIVDQGDIHVSGHPCQDDLKQMYDWLKPDILVPVHGEDMHIKKHAEFGMEHGIPHVVRPHNGMMFDLSSDTPSIVTTVPHGRLMVDGKRLIVSTSPVIKERERLAASGMLSLVVVVSKKDKTRVLSRIISDIGIFNDREERDDFEPLLKKAAADHVRSGTSSIKDRRHTIRELKRAVLDIFSKEMGIMPNVKVHIVDV
jgi:ribonuclease J